MTQDPYAPPEARTHKLSSTHPGRFRSYFLAGFVGNLVLLVALSFFLQGRFLAYVQDFDFFLLSLGLFSLIGAALVIPIGNRWPRAALPAAPIATFAVLGLMYSLFWIWN